MVSAESLDGGLIHAGHRLYHSILVPKIDVVVGLVDVGS